MPTESDYVQVPRRLMLELAAYADDSGERRVAVPANGEWTESMVRQLKQEVARYQGAWAALDLAASNAGRPVSLDEIQENCRLERKQIASDLGAMSKLTRRLWGKVMWPMRSMQTGAGMTYFMDAEIAAWWSS
ncbi:MAG: hypothetical protein JWN46_1980 [Acidimicrobiales bacterium]|nr:hypothetical protein [Acidimicrobiales bacterium]